ncbi:neutral zinc metallopeptidase [Dactylosporangium cerinum]|uniref:Neutral zinc metallopeptidase n=1 Tax=Dactylosporangium cerinum TaxID=1434730 RepID=A0ABV9WEQ0_9ACTN
MAVLVALASGCGGGSGGSASAPAYHADDATTASDRTGSHADDDEDTPAPRTTPTRATSTRTTSTKTASTRTTPARTTRPSTPAGCPNNSLEHCFTYSGMEAFYKEAIKFVDQFMAGSYKNMPRPAHYYYLRHGMTASGPCGGPDDTAYEYCPANDSVYLGQDSLWEFYRETGDAGAVVGLAHEVGHHIQTTARVPLPSTAAQGIRHENQADCIAGAFVRFADGKGWLEYPDDLNDLDALLRKIASAEGPDRDHGTLAERTRSMRLGINGGLKACNPFFPATPVIS